MPWTPESCITAERLPIPVISDASIVNVDVGSFKPMIIQKIHFQVSWSPWGDSGITIDPIVELWRPINELQRVDTDLHMSIFKYGQDQVVDGVSVRTYEVSYGPMNRKNVALKKLVKEAEDLIPNMLHNLKEVCEGWCTADNGLAIFLKERNKHSIDEYLIGIGLKRKVESEPDKETIKEQRRKAYLEEHPEHARTAKPRNKSTKPAPKKA